MTPFRKWVRRAVDKIAGTYEEGPTPPPRVRELVIVFANLHPHATRAEWAEFAASHAEEAYKLAFIRGVEHTERDPDWRPNPDVIADALDPGWRGNPPFDSLADPDGEVRAAWSEEELTRHDLDAVLMLGARRG